MRKRIFSNCCHAEMSDRNVHDTLCPACKEHCGLVIIEEK